MVTHIFLAAKFPPLHPADCSTTDPAESKLILHKGVVVCHVFTIASAVSLTHSIYLVANNN